MADEDQQEAQPSEKPDPAQAEPVHHEKPEQDIASDEEIRTTRIGPRERAIERRERSE
jgi:hypothetical protein